MQSYYNKWRGNKNTFLQRKFTIEIAIIQVKYHVLNNLYRNMTRWLEVTRAGEEFYKSILFFLFFELNFFLLFKFF